MARIFRSLPPGPVCIIGADIPDVSRVQIAAAFRALGNHDAAFGPATDGGYWLVGLKRTMQPPPTFLANVRWSTEHALADSKATLPGYRISHVHTLRDVDTVQDLQCRKGTRPL